MDDNRGINDDAAGGAGELDWRETYVVLFESAARPTLTQVEAAIGSAGGLLKIEKLLADDDGYFKSVLVEAPEDNAVLDIRYEAGMAITERAMTLAEQMRDDLEGDQMPKLLSSDAWLEIMHFERVDAAESEDSEFGDNEFGDAEPDDDMMGPEGLDPATLITVVEALANLTDGLPIDPEAGEIVVI